MMRSQWEPYFWTVPQAQPPHKFFEVPCAS